jgi:hypothetical protein
MTHRITPTLLLAVASALTIAGSSGLASPVHAQERTLAPTGEKVCAECGAVRDKGDVCPFCGAKETVAKPATPRTPDPNPAPAKPADELPGSTNPGPREPVRPATPATPGPAAPAPKPADATPEDETVADQKARTYKDDNVAKGDYYFKTGYYLKASEAYRVAVLAEPGNPYKKLAFGHALFAIGNYSYSSYALRRATQQLDQKSAFNPDVATLFPSKKAFDKAVKDLKRYVTYSPRDPAGLSVLGYMLYAQGEDDRAREMFVYLQRLPKNDQDAFAAYFLKQIDGRKGTKGPDLSDPKPPLTPEPPKAEPVPVPRKETPVPAGKGVAPPEAQRQEEEPANVKPAPARAVAE